MGHREGLLLLPDAGSGAAQKCWELEGQDHGRLFLTWGFRESESWWEDGGEAAGLARGPWLWGGSAGLQGFVKSGCWEERWG